MVKATAQEDASNTATTNETKVDSSHGNVVNGQTKGKTRLMHLSAAGSRTISPLLEEHSEAMCPLLGLLAIQSLYSAWESSKWLPSDGQVKQLEEVLNKEKDAIQSQFRRIKAVQDCNSTVSALLTTPVLSSTLASCQGQGNEPDEIALTFQNVVDKLNTTGLVPTESLPIASLFSITSSGGSSSFPRGHSTLVAISFRFQSAFKTRFLVAGYLLTANHDVSNFQVEVFESDKLAADCIMGLLEKLDATAFRPYFVAQTGGLPIDPASNGTGDRGIFNDATPRSTPSNEGTSEDTVTPPAKSPSPAVSSKPKRRKAAPSQSKVPRKSGDDFSWMLSLQNRSVVPKPSDVETQPSTEDNEPDSPSVDLKVQMHSEDQLQLLFGRPQQRTGKGKPADSPSDTRAGNANVEASSESVEASSTGRGGAGSSKPKDSFKSTKSQDFQWQLNLMSLQPIVYENVSNVSRGSTAGTKRAPKVNGSWSPLMLRPELADDGEDWVNDTELNPFYDAKDKGKGKQTTRQGSGELTVAEAFTYRRARNEFAWQFALASMSLKPSEDYMKEREEQIKMLKIELGQIPFDCLICFEKIEWDDGARMKECEHSFCKSCASGHVVSKLQEGEFPIFCPVCFCDRDRKGPRGVVDEALMFELDLSQKDQDKYVELQMAQVSITLDCPACKKSMQIAREDYLAEPFIVCPLPPCKKRFCRACQLLVAGTETQHACKIDEALDELMKANGWRYCPGCKTPVQKESGCNHMTCRTPGCSAHFCYTCGEMIWDATYTNTLGLEISNHYKKCSQFDTTPPVPVNVAVNAAVNANRGRRRNGECLIQ
ncbi:hypothetical protein FA15DRAFT_755248 [Coprinopsis marcescibilis]|uniref:RING-type domain-containing protein n=1 Tax=Coprinopsis marcescibilis TaxID=230819 RepID=A0A5C3KZX0_COPMA|nr:hypothetical protein FA15DRAFT_755248 [Coprinopsis marcescibilis]